jgi:protein TonB
VGGAVKAPRKVRDVLPVYPVIARAARAQGTVILRAVITKEGRVRDVRVERSIAMLDAAAIDAVRQWQYTVPTLNGQPVDVSMIVTVHFELR